MSVVPLIVAAGAYGCRFDGFNKGAKGEEVIRPSYADARRIAASLGLTVADPRVFDKQPQHVWQPGEPRPR